MASIIKANQLQDFGGNSIITSDGAGNLTTQKTLYPAFEAHSTGNQDVSDATATKVEFQTEVFDTNNMYDNSRFTPTVAGKYFIYAGVNSYAGGSADLVSADLSIYKNGSLYRQNYHNMTGNPGFAFGTPISAILIMNGTSDYVEIYGAVDGNSAGNEKFFTDNNYFGAYRIGS